MPRHLKITRAAAPIVKRAAKSPVVKRSVTRPVTRLRRSPAEIEAIELAIFDVCEEMEPLTVRGLYYQLVSRGVIDKTEREYKMVVHRSGIMRERGDLPFSWLVDSTRLRRKPDTHSSLHGMMEESAQLYRRALWNDQPWYAEVWAEKDTITGVLYEITARWDVPLMICRGYPSKTFLHSAAEEITAQRKPTMIFYLGDYDPSGKDIARTVEAGLRRYAPDAEIIFQSLAVNPDHIERWNLPTRPTKSTDSRAAGFVGESVEIDAIAPDDLRELVGDAIERLIDEEVLERMRMVESAERDTLRQFTQRLDPRGATPD